MTALCRFAIHSIGIMHWQHFTEGASSIGLQRIYKQSVLYGVGPPPTLQLAQQQVGAVQPYNNTVHY